MVAVIAARVFLPPALICLEPTFFKGKASGPFLFEVSITCRGDVSEKESLGIMRGRKTPHLGKKKY